MPKFYHTFYETRYYSASVEAPNIEAAKRFFGNIEQNRCSWDNTTYDDLEYYDVDEANDMGFDTESEPDFKCDASGKEI